MKFRNEDLTGALISGVISCVIIASILADTAVAAALGTLEKLVLSFVTVAISAGLVRKAFKNAT